MRFTSPLQARLPIAVMVGIACVSALVIAGLPSAALELPRQAVVAPDFERMLRDGELPAAELPADFGEDSYLLRTYGYTRDGAIGVLAEAGSGVVSPPRPPRDSGGLALFSIAPDIGYEMWRPLVEVAGEEGRLYYGAVVNFANIHPETPAFCLDLNRDGPQGKPGSAKNIDGSDLDDLADGRYSPPARYDISGAELATLLAHYGQDASANPVSVAALGLLTHVNFEMSADANSYVGAYLAAWESNGTDAELGTTAKERTALVEALVKWARTRTPAPSGWSKPTVSLDADRRSGQVADIRVANERGDLIPDLPYTLTLSGPAAFTGGKTSVQGTTSSSAIDHSFIATGNGIVTARVTYGHLSPTLRYSEPTQSGAQRTVQPQDPIPADKTLSAESVTVVQDFQPTLSSQVASEFIEAGTKFKDDITISADPGYDNPHWIKIGQDYVPATVETRVYWSLTPPTEPSTTAQSGWQLLEAFSQTFDGPGTKRIGVTAAEPGYYVAQSELKIDEQPQEWRSFFAADAAYDFGLSNETQVARFSPTLTTRASHRLAVPGQTTFDAVTVSLPAETSWPTGMTVLAEGTLYGPFESPLPRSAAAPAQAPIASTSTLVFSSDQQTLSARWTAEEQGFYTWVWRIDKDAQDDPRLLANSFTDDFMIEEETIGVLQPGLPATALDARIDSELAETGWGHRLLVVCAIGTLGFGALLTALTRRGRS